MDNLDIWELRKIADELWEQAKKVGDRDAKDIVKQAASNLHAKAAEAERENKNNAI